MEGKASISKDEFLKIMEMRCIVKQVYDQCDFFFLTKGNPFTSLNDDGPIDGKGFRKVLRNLGDGLSEKEYADIWTMTGIAEPSDTDTVDTDSLYKALDDRLRA